MSFIQCILGPSPGLLFGSLQGIWMVRLPKGIFGASFPRQSDISRSTLQSFILILLWKGLHLIAVMCSWPRLGRPDCYRTCLSLLQLAVEQVNFQMEIAVRNVICCLIKPCLAGAKCCWRSEMLRLASVSAKEKWLQIDVLSMLVYL